MSEPSPQAPPPLLPCPFCGGDAELAPSSGVSPYFVVCNDCGAEGPPTSTRDCAMELWNHRTPEPPAPAGGTDEKGPYTWIKYYTTPVERPPFTLPDEFYEPDEPSGKCPDCGDPDCGKVEMVRPAPAANTAYHPFAAGDGSCLYCQKPEDHPVHQRPMVPTTAKEWIQDRFTLDKATIAPRPVERATKNEADELEALLTEVKR